ncbi:MFS transporter [Streptomyces sp. NPDC006172]|uniref:MFS transporter n=1 Tax=Streptomyces sp. NPDC006172 TaxID=3154470 RepID=UPI0033F67775
MSYPRNVLPVKKRYALSWYLTGALTARTGDEMSGPALLLAAYALTGSAARASVLLAAATVAAAVGGPVLGVLLDRAERPDRLLAAALALHALGLAAVLLTLDRLPFPLTLLLAVLSGLPGPALSAGWTARMPLTTSRAAALDAMTFDAASLAGPSLAALVTRLSSAQAAVVTAVTLICTAIPAALRLPGRGAGGSEPAAPRRPESATASGVSGSAVSAPVGEGPLRVRVLAGARYVLARPALAAVTAGSVVSSVGQGVLTACVPLLGERVLGGAADGALLPALAAGSALVANAVHARRAPGADPVRVMCAGALSQAAGAALAVAAGAADTADTAAVTLVLASALVIGAGEGPQLAGLFAVRHRETPERLRGQVFTTGASAKITGFALGAAGGGALGTWSLTGALLTAATLQLAAARVTAGRA